MTTVQRSEDGWACKIFRYEDLRVRVRCSDPTHLAWLEEFLCPDFALDDAPMVDHTVTVDIDTGRHAELERRGPAPGAPAMDCFALDSSMVRLPVWRTGANETVVFEPEYDVFYVVDASRESIRIHALRGHPGVRVGLMRVVRELAMLDRQRSGAVVVHGATVVSRGRGVVIAGPKKAGKTTLLLHLLEAAGCQYLANDRVTVRSGPERPELRGMPTIVAVRDDTAQRFPWLEGRILERRFHWRATVEEAAHQPARRSAGGAWLLSPTQLCTLFGVQRRGAAPLAAFIFPCVTGAPGPMALTPLAPDEALERLRGALFRARWTEQCPEMLAAPGDDTRPGESRDAACARLAQTIPSYACALGQDAYSDAGAMVRLLDGVLQ